MSSTCPESSAVEALRDGRLVAERAAALRAHLSLCEECAGEARRLDSLSVDLLAMPEPQVSPFRIAADRRQLLEAAGRQEVHAPPRVRWAAVGLLGISVAAGAALVTRLTGSLSRHPGSAAASSPVPVSGPGEAALELDVSAGKDAHWSRSETTSEVKLRLLSGELTVQVDRHGANRRLLVELPDGELEDEGTVFSVSVVEGHTRDVSVARGRVALRLNGRAEQHLTAGQAFHDDGSGPGAAAGSSAQAASAPVVPAPSSRGVRPVSSSHEDATACPGAPRFETCVEAFKRGEYANAAGLLERYSATCGRHAEDATYLEMVSLARAGRSDAAKGLARTYLDRFPNGFRRKEAERLAHPD